MSPPFQYVDNEWYGNPVVASFYGDSMSVGKHIANLENIYQSMLA